MRQVLRTLTLAVRVLPLTLCALVGPAAAQRIPRPPVNFFVPAVIVAPATFLPALGTSISDLMCSDYNAYVTTNGAGHPGQCRNTDYAPLLEGLPAAQYAQTLAGDGVPEPYTVTYQTTPATVCASASNFHIHLSAQVRQNFLNWPHGRPLTSACAVEWNRHDPALNPSGLVLQGQVASYLADYARDLTGAVGGPAPITACVTAPPFSGAAFQPFARRQLLAQVAQLLSAVAAQEQARWAALRAGIDDPAKCALRCNQCAPGWAGTIRLDETLNSTNPTVTGRHTETDVFFVGGTTPGPQTLVLADWSATGGGTKTPQSGVSSNWTVNALKAGSCSNTPGGCVLVKTEATGLTSFNPENQPFVVAGGIQYAQGTGAPQPYGASETQFPTVYSASPGQTVVSGQTPVNTVGVCAAPAFPTPYLCTQQWSWYLTLQ